MGQPDTTSNTPDVDGRTARRDRNREAVLDAAIALFQAGEVAPSAAQIAQHAGVSLRSVFRYFDDTEALKRAAMEHHFHRVAPLFEIDEPGVGDLDGRIARFVEARQRLYEAVGPSAQVALSRASTDPLISERLARTRELLRKQTEAMFAPELDTRSAAERRSVLAVADTLFQLEAVRHMRLHLGLNGPQIADALRRALHALLD